MPKIQWERLPREKCGPPLWPIDRPCGKWRWTGPPAVDGFPKLHPCNPATRTALCKLRDIFEVLCGASLAVSSQISGIAAPPAVSGETHRFPLRGGCAFSHRRYPDSDRHGCSMGAAWNRRARTGDPSSRHFAGGRTRRPETGQTTSGPWHCHGVEDESRSQPESS